MTVHSLDLAAKKREAALLTGRRYLERYIYLLLFNAHVCRNVDRKSSQYVSPSASGRVASFKEWIEGDHELRRRLYPLLDGLRLH